MLYFGYPSYRLVETNVGVQVLKISFFKSFRFKLLSTLLIIPILSLAAFLFLGLDSWKENIDSNRLQNALQKTKQKANSLGLGINGRYEISVALLNEVLDDPQKRSFAVFNSNEYFLSFKLIDQKSKKEIIKLEHPRLKNFDKSLFQNSSVLDKINYYFTTKDNNYVFIKRKYQENYSFEALFQLPKNYLASEDEEKESLLIANEKEILANQFSKGFNVNDTQSLYEAWQKLSFKNSSGAFFHRASSNNYLISYVKLPNSQESILQVVPSSTAYAQIQAMFGQLLLIFFISISLAMMAGIYFSRKHSQSIEGLAQMGERLGAGELGVQYQAEGDDEVSRLAKTLSRASESLRKQFETNKKKKQEISETKTIALRDRLTDLNNYLAFETYTSKVFENKKMAGKSFGFYLLDIDKFKTFNDTYGHLQGDEVLKTVAKVMKKVAEQRQFVGRYGGEEFVSIFPINRVDEVAIKMEKMREAIENTKVDYLEKEGKKLSVTASFGGIAFQIPEDASFETHMKDFIKIADENLYLAKENGRNNCVFRNLIQQS